METNRSEEMLKYVEGYYRESKYYLSQNNAKGEELNILHAILEDLPNQFNPQTATWGLRLWDELLEIDGGIQSVEERRARVMMKLIALPRITPISLERLIKNIAKANVDIIRNVSPYTFQIRVREDSLDCNSSLIRQIVEDYKEAHMAFYQDYYLGRIRVIEHFYLKIMHRMTIYWFRQDCLLNGSHLLNGDMKLGFVFPPYRLLVRNRYTAVILEHFLANAMRNTFWVETTERAEIRGFLRFAFYWWSGAKVLLNGKNFLDGETFLNQEFPPYKMFLRNRFTVAIPEAFDSRIIWNTFGMKNEEKAVIRSVFRSVIYWWSGALNGRYQLDGKENLGNGLPEYKMKNTNRFQVYNQESISPPTVTITHNLWHLDGTFLMDGSQVMDAYQIKEVWE